MSGLVGLGLSPPFTRRRLPLPPTIIYRVVERNPRTGRLLASHEDSLSVVRLYDVDPSSGAVVGTLLVARVDSDACVAHARHVAPGGPAVRGQPWQFLVSFPSHPGAAYVTVASFGVGSGVRLPAGRRVFLRPDPLTLLSLSGSPLFDRFHGYLDSGGEAIAAVRIPRSANLAGTRFFVVSLVMRGGLVAGVSDPVGVTIR